MPIDSETKRRSVIQYAPFTLAPVPDGTIDAADREQATWLYSGIAVGGVAVTGSTGVFGYVMQHRHTNKCGRCRVWWLTWLLGG